MADRFLREVRVHIRCWGARGSIPVSGPEYIKYGGDTACIEIRTARNGRVIVVDAGSGLRALSNQLLREEHRDYIFLFTHAHWDHILGFPFFKPLYRPEVTIRLFGCPIAQGNMRSLLARTMSAPYFPVPFDEVRAKIVYEEHCTQPLTLDGVRVETIALSHPNMGLGFRFTENDKSFVFLTDNELQHRHRGGRSLEEYIAFCRGADLLLHDAEYFPEEYDQRRGWGHSTCDQAVDLALAARVGMLGLFHHNQDRDDAGVDLMLARSQKRVREQSAKMRCLAVSQEWAITL